MLRDFTYAQISNTGFYWNESLVFQNYWIWLPLIVLVFNFFNKRLSENSRSFFSQFIVVVGCTALQLFLHVITIMLFAKISGLPYRFSTVLGSAVHEFAVLGLLVNTVLWLIYRLPEKIGREKGSFNENIIAKSGTKQTIIPLGDILYFQKDENYVRVKTATKSFLISGSLKELTKKIDNSRFVQIHKSTIVNRGFVQFSKSRKNGDYDILLTSNETLRLSRRYRERYFQNDGQG